MTARLNRFLLEQTYHDSGALVQPDFVVHPCTHAGRHQVDVQRHGKLITSIMLDVDPEHSDKQVSIDLAALQQPEQKEDCCCHDKAPVYRVSQHGYALFYVGSGSGGYSVKSFPLNDGQEGAPFDSQHLQQGDLFGTTLLRPGRYRLEDPPNKVSVILHVEAVKPGRTRYVPPDALQLDIPELRKHKELRLQQAQGIVICAERDNRLLIQWDDKEPGSCHDDEPPRPVARISRNSQLRHKGDAPSR